MSNFTEIRVSNLKKEFGNPNGGIRVLDGFSLSIKRSEFITIFGPNGCGKSTLLHILAEIEDLDEGTVEYKEERFNKIPIGFVFQDYVGSLFNWLTALDNIILPIFVKNIYVRDDLKEKAREFLEKYEFLDLLHNLKKYPYQLSGGQQQMVSIARALFSKPEILFLDEPFSSLDLHNRKTMQLILQQYWLENKNTIIFVSHEIDEAILLADRFILMSQKPMNMVKEWKINFYRTRSQKLYNDEVFLEIRKDVISAIMEKML